MLKQSPAVLVFDVAKSRDFNQISCSSSSSKQKMSSWQTISSGEAGSIMLGEVISGLQSRVKTLENQLTEAKEVEQFTLPRGHVT